MFDIAKLSKAIKSEQDGFTLVELMVVVVIIGVLVAIAVPIYNTITDDAEEAAIDANERTLDGAWMQYQASGGEDGDEEWPGDFINVDSGNETTVTIDGVDYTREEHGSTWSGPSDDPS